MKQTGTTIKGYRIKDGKLEKITGFGQTFTQRLAAKKKAKTPRLKRTR
jgi:hypothetical protein